MWMKHQRSNTFSFYVLIRFSIFVLIAGAAQGKIHPIRSLYQFGDSFADTGNSIRLVSSRLVSSPVSSPPYGETFPGYPTGRWSDGRLIIDYIAMALKLPLLNPYLDTASSFDNGVNFAVGGSTALNSSFFSARGINVLPVPSLSVQLSWFRTYLKSICSTPTGCAAKLSRSLVFVGETGYNDLAYSISQGIPLQEIQTYIPLVVQAIINTTREVIKAGASKVVVPGTFPLGCFPAVLSALASNDTASYDDIGCSKSANNLTTSLNNELQGALVSLRKEFLNVVILYADYDNAFQSILRNAAILGFNTTVLLKPCCGSDQGTYDLFGGTGFCGDPEVPVCPNPNNYIHWDGIHLTQETYRLMSKILIKDLKIN